MYQNRELEISAHAFKAEVGNRVFRTISRFADRAT